MASLGGDIELFGMCTKHLDYFIFMLTGSCVGDCRNCGMQIIND